MGPDDGSDDARRDRRGRVRGDRGGRRWAPRRWRERLGVDSTVSTVAGGGRDLSTVTDDEMEAVIKQNPSITPMRLALIERYLKEGNLERRRSTRSSRSTTTPPSPIGARR